MKIKITSIALVILMLVTVLVFCPNTLADETDLCCVEFDGRYVPLYFQSDPENCATTVRLYVERGTVLTVDDVPRSAPLEGGNNGLTLSGWTPIDPIGFIVNNNVKFTALFEQTSFYCRFYDYDDTPISMYEDYFCTYPRGASVTPPSAPQHEGLVFSGWSSDGYMNLQQHEHINAKYIMLNDVNLDGVVNTGDAVLLLRVSVDLEELSPTAQLVADVNGDGSIDSGDAAAVLRVAVS